MTINGGISFDKYVLPESNFSAAASKVTGLTKKGKYLFSCGKLVPSIHIKEGLELFSEWLSSLNDKIILLGHNIKVFDIKHLWRHIKENDLGSHFDTVVGYVDTLPLFKHIFPEESSYCQRHLYQKIVGGDFHAHNSLEDVKALATMLRLANVDEKMLRNFSMTSSWVEKYYNFHSEKKRNIDSFQELLQNRVMSKGMIEKTASSGLNYEHLKVVFVRNGEEGLRSLFGAHVLHNVKSGI